MVSVCIPAYNEAETITAVLDSLRGQEGVSIEEVRVCANGCSDATAELVRLAGADRPELILLERSWKSKAKAWNELRRASRGEILIFVDGDVYLPAHTVAALVRELLDEPELIAVTAQPMPKRAKKSGLDRLIALPSDPQPPKGLCGGCYAVRSEALTRRLAAWGYSEMPEDVIAEDRWLSELIGPGRWRHMPEAPVYYVYPALRDMPAQMKRHMRARLQFRFHYPRMYRASLERALPRLSAILREWRNRENMGAFLRRIVTALLLRAIHLYARLAVLYTPRPLRFRAWDRTPSTKRKVSALEPA